MKKQHASCNLRPGKRSVRTMKISRLSHFVQGLAIVIFSAGLLADEAPVGGARSLESRMQELETKLKDAGYTGVKGDGIKISGYVESSYTANLSDRDNSGPIAGGSQAAGVGNVGRVFDTQFNSFNLNAVKLVFEKDRDDSRYPAGFRVDLMYGNDATVINGGNSQGGVANDSEFAVEQAFIVLGVPIGNTVDVRFGKTVSLLGYEATESPVNGQFSRSDAYRLGPVTQSGVTLGYKWNDYLTSTVGAVNGWDITGGGGTIFGSGNRNLDLSFVGRLDAAAPASSLGQFTGFACALYGNDNLTPPTGTGLPATFTTSNNSEQYIWNVGGTWNNCCNCKPLGLGVDFLYRSDTVNTAAFAAGGTPMAKIDASALSTYARWDWNKWLTSSGRFSYSWYGNARQNAAGAVASQESLGPLTIPSGAGSTIPSTTDNFSFTLTQAFNVWKDTLLRLEWRHDWTTTGAVGFGAASATAAARDDIRQEQDTIAVNLVYSF